MMNLRFAIEFTQKLAWILFVSSIVLVMFATLYPFNFQIPDHFPNKSFVNSINTTPKDLLVNLCLLSPFGFSLTWLFYLQKKRSIFLSLIVISCSCSFSLIIETLQIFLPSRYSTVNDIFTNTLSGIWGFLLFQIWRWTVLGKINKHFTFKKTLTYFLGYFLIVSFVSLALQNTTQLVNWNDNYFLALGNETNGIRPWNGSISEIYFADRSISSREAEQLLTTKRPGKILKNSLVGLYRIKSHYQVKDVTKNLPNLVLRRLQKQFDRKSDPYFNNNRWLITEKPVTFLSQKIRQSSQFTASIIFTNQQRNLQGPIPIFAIANSELIYLRNLTIEQHQEDLYIRLRTPITGEHGVKPQLVLLNFFHDLAAHHLIFTYDGSTIKIYIDRVQNSYSLEFNPGLALFQRIFSIEDNWRIYLRKSSLEIYKLLYYLIVFVPLGLCLGIMLVQLRGRFPFYLLLVISGVILPSLAIDLCLTTGSGRNLSISNLVLSTLILSLVAITVKLIQSNQIYSARKNV